MILIIIAVINCFIATILILKNSKSFINISFAIFFYGASIWSFGLSMFNITMNLEAAMAWAKIYYFGAAIIALAFLLFANNFIYSFHKITEVRMLYLFIPFITVVFVIFHPTFLIENVSHYNWGNEANEKLFGHLLFAAYFFTYVIMAFRILFIKLKNLDGVNRRSLNIIIWSSLISFIFGVTFDLALPLSGYYKLVWLGPYFSIVTSIFLTYLIFYKPKTN